MDEFLWPTATLGEWIATTACCQALALTAIRQSLRSTVRVGKALGLAQGFAIPIALTSELDLKEESAGQGAQRSSGEAETDR